MATDAATSGNVREAGQFQAAALEPLLLRLVVALAGQSSQRGGR